MECIIFSDGLRERLVKCTRISFFFFSPLANYWLCKARKSRQLRDGSYPCSHDVRGCRRHCSRKGWLHGQQDGSRTDTRTLGSEDNLLSCAHVCLGLGDTGMIVMTGKYGRRSILWRCFLCFLFLICFDMGCTMLLSRRGRSFHPFVYYYFHYYDVWVRSVHVTIKNTTYFLLPPQG